MAYPFNPHPARQSPIRTAPAVEPTEWRCLDCRKLLGVRHGLRLHIRLQRHNYLVSLPVEVVCHGCGAKNLA
jgi:hypothetical protein